MKGPIKKRNASGIVDSVALALTTFGVGYIPGAPGTYGSAIGVAIYLGIGWFESHAAGHAENPAFVPAFHYAVNAILLGAFCLIGIWASDRTEAIFGQGDPPQAVVDEVMGQLVTFAFMPFIFDWHFILAGFLLFRLFDIVKPYPCNKLQDIPGGLGICADDLIAGVYAGICLAAGYAVTLM